MSVQLVSGLQAEFFGEHFGPFQRIAAQCESPIEAAMFWAVLIAGKSYGAWGPVANEDQGMVVFADSTLVHPQRWVTVEGKRYRLDLALMRGVALVAVECDGHNFHERSKEQASHDKTRDIAVQKAGWRVARFTGSDINQDPIRCALEVWALAQATQETVVAG